jgi:hypothetical protein
MTTNGLTDYWRFGVNCESRISVTEARGQFEGSEEGEHAPLEAVTKGLMTRHQTEKAVLTVVNCRLCELVIAPQR